MQLPPIKMEHDTSAARGVGRKVNNNDGEEAANNNLSKLFKSNQLSLKHTYRILYK